MFGLSKKSTADRHIETLSRQVIGGQSVLYSLFKDILEKSDDEIDKMELTYFSLTTMGYFYIKMSGYDQREGVFNLVCNKVLEDNGDTSVIMIMGIRPLLW